MGDELDVQTNFRSQDWETAREALDATFHRIFDIIKSNPTLHALVDGRDGEPTHKAGDFVTDYRTGDVKLKMSDGKNLLEISLSALGGSISADQHGALGFETSTGSQLHTNATTSNPGFMSAADKVAVNGISSPPSPSNATPISNPLGGSGAAGASANYSRADHVHPVASSTTPSPIGTAAVGTSTQPARADHVHAHGNQGGGTQHAVAGALAGFMSAADKSKLDLFDGYVSGGAAPTPSVGHFSIWYDSAGGGNLYLVSTGGGGTKKVMLNL